MMQGLRSRLIAWCAERAHRRAKVQRIIDIFHGGQRPIRDGAPPRSRPDWPSPDSDAARHPLFRWACERMSDRMIDEMAYCDPGYEENYVELIRIRNSGVVPPDLDFCASEPCSLWQWGVDERRKAHEHVSTIFATCILLIAGAHPECDGGNLVGETMSDQVASFLWSVIALGTVDEEARLFLDWLDGQMWANFEHTKGDGSPSSFAALAALILAVHRGASAAEIETSTKALVDPEQREDQMLQYGRNEDPRWRTRPVLRLSNYDQHHRLWEQMAKTAHDTLKACTDAVQMPTAIDLLARVADIGP